MGDSGKGDHVERSLDDLTWEAYQELRATARRRLRRERGYHILQTTALRTKRSSGCLLNVCPAGDGPHLLAAGATEMRRVLVDHACAWNSTAAPPIRMPRSLGGGTPFPPPPVFLHDSGGLTGTPGDSRRQQVEAEPRVPLRCGR